MSQLKLKRTLDGKQTLYIHPQYQNIISCMSDRSKVQITIIYSEVCKNYDNHKTNKKRI